MQRCASSVAQAPAPARVCGRARLPREPRQPTASEGACGEGVSSRARAEKRRAGYLCGDVLGKVDALRIVPLGDGGARDEGRHRHGRGLRPTAQAPVRHAQPTTEGPASSVRGPTNTGEHEARFLTTELCFVSYLVSSPVWRRISSEIATPTECRRAPRAVPELLLGGWSLLPCRVRWAHVSSRRPAVARAAGAAGPLLHPRPFAGLPPADGRGAAKGRSRPVLGCERPVATAEGAHTAFPQSRASRRRL